MHAIKYMWVLVFCSIALQSTHVFPALLEDTMVLMDEFEGGSVLAVQSLKREDEVVTDDQNNVCKKSKVVAIEKLAQPLKKGIAIEFMADGGTVGTLIVSDDQKFCVKGDGRTSYVLWLQAEELQVGMLVRGLDDKWLYVNKLLKVEFECDHNAYCVSLERNHTFYIADSSNNYILTHNEPLTCFFIGLGVGFLGSSFGAGFYSLRCWWKGEPVDEDVLWKCALVGGLTAGLGTLGAWGAHGLYQGGCLIAAKYLPVLIQKFSGQLTPRAIRALQKIANEIANADPLAIYWIGIAAVGSEIAMATTYVNAIADETYRRKKTDIDLGSGDPEFSKPLVETPVYDKDGKLLRDEYGNPLTLSVRKVNAGV